MSIPVLVLLLFALWTMFTMIAFLGSYRLGRIWSGRGRPREYAFPDLETSDWHRRAVRAHLNCLENLPIYGAIVLAIVVTQISSPTLDRLAIVFLSARILHALIHVFLPNRNRVILLRFTVYVAQLVCMIWMGVFTLWKANVFG